MNLKLVEEQKDVAVSAVERLIAIADAMFERASGLETLKSGLKADEEMVIVGELRDDAFRGVINLWKVILDMLPTAPMDPSKRKDLVIDAHKVMSRSYHRLGDLDGAQRNITKAIDLGYLEGFISLGAISIDKKDWDGAENAFRSAIAKDVEVMRAHAGLGELYFMLGTMKLKDNPEHKDFFQKAEEEFVAAGKQRFTEAYERAMDLFEAMGWKERALSVAERAAQYYEEHRSIYGDKLRSIDMRIRNLAGDERHDRLVSGVSRKLGDLLGGKLKDNNRS